VVVIFFTAFLMLLMSLVLLKVIKWSEHSYEVIARTRDCEKAAIDAQSEVRGYLLTGDPAFPEAFAKERKQVDREFSDLEKLARSDPQQAIRAQGLIQTKDLWFDHARTAVDQKMRSATVGADWLRMGDDLMTGLRGQFQTFSQVEESLHDERLKSVEWTKWAVVGAGSGLVLILALTVGLLVRRQFVQLATDYRRARDSVEQRHAALVRSEADLEEQKEWFRVTLTSIGDGVMVTDAEGRVVFMNHEAERMTGWTSVESLLKPLDVVFRIVNEETHSKLEDPVSRAFREKRVVGVGNQTVLVARGGEERPIEDSAAPIHDGQGKMLGVVLVFHDATEMRQTQSVMRAHSEELEKRVAERTTALQQMVSELESFSYTVSHDLRSPLRAMQGFAQAVMEDYGDQLDEHGRNYLDRIRNAAERLDRLIQDLLSYTRISRLEAPLVPLDVGEILNDLIQNYPNLHPPAAEVEIEGELPVIMGQEASLTQVLSNLLGNAAKFVRPDTVPHIRVWSEDLGERVRLWIKDNGIGISQDNYERIFQMFVQVDESHLYGGTGVGLAIVKKAVEAMKGSVGLEEADGGGTKFWVELAKASPA
jgi:PAS domain S-box-containing protein